ncbi:hypothetical protein B484DRAFT_433396 [Ochromonadaceae sp. CCMP2298]|nr:hypothetical protein B484DRAFT_433396 [Ochromonadaceae sp. CCMP2298]
MAARQNHKRLSEVMTELNEKRRKRAVQMAPVNEEGWELMDYTKFTYKHREVEAEASRLLYNLRSTEMFPLRLVDVFLKFFNRPLLESMLAGHLAHNPEWANLSKSCKSKRADTSVPMLYRMIAVKIRLYGLQQRPSEHCPIKNPFLSAVKQATSHFDALYGCSGQDVNRTCKLISCFLCTHEYYDQLSANWQSVVREVGEFVAGDEKLLKFFGDAGDIIAVSSKPDSVGLWFYELCAQDRHDRVFLLDTKLQRKHSPAETITMMSVVARWGQIIMDRGRPQTILAFDSHSMCKDSRIWLDQHKDRLRYTASVTFKPFKEHVRKVEALYLAGPAGNGVGGDEVRKPGDWVGMFNPNTSEIFIYAWDEIKAIGHKYNLGNCMVKRARVNTHDNELRHIKGAYDIYKYCFNLCDVYNRALHDRKWPFKRGGNGVADKAIYFRNYTNMSLLDICLLFINRALIISIKTRLSNEDLRWNYIQGTRKADASVQGIYLVLAVKIRMYSLQNTPSESEHNDRPLERAVQEARAHFDDIIPNELQCPLCTMKIMSKVLITQEYFLMLAKNFQDALKELGDYIAGDEKLLQFFGDAKPTQTDT